ncbi:hypothetical protein H6P81_007410 [Aristolochia fimbriata]|uniref:phosphoenolpyruvate carboxykinase (ATP) n=1 Tax=Aristolochia fimbriata TaxID=158543 RepID=A0AAV7F1C3_ARIFI|nr:hypothetical protein H6P81_007410 [Aristolochia fimbriata]
MRNIFVKRFAEGVFSSTRSRSSIAAPAASCSRIIQSRRYAVSQPIVEEQAETVVFPREGLGISYGLNWALAGRGVIVKEKAFHNLKTSELHQKGATTAEHLSGLPIHVRGSTTGGALEISKANFGKLLKQVTTHLSSISNVFVHDGAVCSSPKCDAKVRVISDSPSAVLALSNVLWRTPTRAVSHDSCPLTVYVATSASQSIGESIGLGPEASSGFIAADIERSSVILSGKAFSDLGGAKDSLAALAAPVISARGGLPLSARLLFSGDSLMLVFAQESTIKSCSDLREFDTDIVLSSQGVAPLFRSRDPSAPNLYKLPDAIVFASADSSGALPSVSKLSPGQAAYHFLAGYQNGNFLPGYIMGPSPNNPLELAKGLLSQIKDKKIPSFLVNVNAGEKPVTGKDLVKLIQTTLTESIPPLQSKGDIQEKYKSFLSGKFQELPEEFSF